MRLSSFGILSSRKDEELPESKFPGKYFCYATLYNAISKDQWLAFLITAELNSVLPAFRTM